MIESLEVNREDVVEEIRELFESYESALVCKDVQILDKSFWDSPHTIRYACLLYTSDAADE